MTLKVGDRAKCSFGGGAVTVLDTNAHEEWPIRAEYRSGGTGLWKEFELEKIEPEPKFKVGDRVRALETSAANNIVAGRAYTVRKVKASIVDPDGLLIFEGRNQGVYARRFEKIEEEPPRPLGLQPGDKVVNLKTGREGLVLKGPISGELKVYDKKPPIRDAVPAAALEEYEHWHPGTYDVWRRVTEKKKAQPW